MDVFSPNFKNISRNVLWVLRSSEQRYRVLRTCGMWGFSGGQVSSWTSRDQFFIILETIKVKRTRHFETLLKVTKNMASSLRRPKSCKYIFYWNWNINYFAHLLYNRKRMYHEDLVLTSLRYIGLYTYCTCGYEWKCEGRGCWTVGEFSFLQKMLDVLKQIW